MKWKKEKKTEKEENRQHGKEEEEKWGEKKLAQRRSVNGFIFLVSEYEGCWSVSFTT